MRHNERTELFISVLFERFTTFLAPAVRTDYTNAALVAAERASFPFNVRPAALIFIGHTLSPEFCMGVLFPAVELTHQCSYDVFLNLALNFKFNTDPLF